MNYLITGCAGFIGYHITQSLTNSGNNVVGVDNLNNYYNVKLKKDRLQLLKSKKFKFFKFNLNNKTKLKKIFSKYKFDYIIHLAAQAGVRYSIDNPQKYIESNILATTNLFEAIKKHKIKKVLVASSSSVYGTQKKKKFSEKFQTNTPLSFYAASKISTENISYYYSKHLNLPVSVLRFFTVYGPFGRPDMAYFKFTKNILNNRSIDVYNYGKHYRDFTYISDVVRFIRSILKKKNSGFEVLNLGKGNPQSLKKFIEIIEKNLNIKAKKNYIDMQLGDVHGTFADISIFNKKYKTRPKVDLKQGIKLFVNWYKTYNKSR